MKAVMLVGGRGTRGYPFTILTPKLFQQVCGIPVLEYMLAWFLQSAEIEKLYFVVSDAKMADTLRLYFKKRREYAGAILGLFARLGMHIEDCNPNLCVETISGKGWGTGGDLMVALNQIALDEKTDDDILVCYGDYVVLRRLTDGRLSPQLDISGFTAYHTACKKAMNTVVTIGLVPVSREEAVRFGVARLSHVGELDLVCGFVEKPEIGDIPEAPQINAGVYLIDRRFALDPDEFLPQQPGTDLSRSLLPKLACADNPRLAAYRLGLEAWFDIGTPEQLLDANRYVATVVSDGRTGELAGRGHCCPK